ncbi:MAG TPA: sulfite exporter TauE/SafE family protein [Candidatus Acidoferrales bacterium]|nr:sulfite exporter TauE/SafE family protein [Candidatus Acidoferrales bacterium]
MSLVWISLIGLFAGVLSGMFGIGGGVVIVPALVLLLHLSPQKATGTSLGALLLPVGLLGALQYWKRGDVDIRFSLILAAGLFLGARFGASVGLSLAPATLRRAFAVFLVLVAGQMWFRK